MSSEATAQSGILEAGIGVVEEKLRSELVESWLSKVGGEKLTAAERAEVHSMAAGLRVIESARASGITVETVRKRRKSVYRKLGLDGAHSVMQALLALTLNRMAGRA